MKARNAFPAIVAALILLSQNPVSLRGQEDEASAPPVFTPEQEARIAELQEDSFSRGIIGLEGAEIEFGGKLELNFVDVQVDRNGALGGPTDNPDPHLIFDRLRLEPVIDLGRGIRVVGQLDFLADDDSFIKEASFQHEYDFNDWAKSEFQIGLDDQFIHRGPTQRLTESYPLLGEAFWRDEEIAMIWALSIGHARGDPATMPGESGDEWPPRSALTSSTSHEPLDFANNPGQLTLHLSLGNGQTLDEHSVNKDDGDLQQLLHDDRETEDGLALRDFGVGVSYARDFNRFGEIHVMAFYFHDELNDRSVNFLQQNLTIFDNLTNAPLAGYGLNSSEQKRRFGVTVEYHLEAFHLIERWVNTSPGDGLYLVAQWIDAKDGALERDGFYVQGSYRYTFEKPLLGERYIRSIEPFVRYGELDVNMASIASLPLTWDREELVFGAVSDITGRVSMKAEYSMHDEGTGAGSVNNDQLLVQLLLQF